MSEDKKKYICKLPTNGYEAGQEAMLTDAEAANFNGGEATPRFVLAGEEGAVDAPNPEMTADTIVSGEADTVASTEEASASASSTGSYDGDSDVVPPVDTETTPPTPGVE